MRPAVFFSLAARSTLILTCFNCSCALEDGMRHIYYGTSLTWVLQLKTVGKQPPAEINDACAEKGR